MRSLILKFPIKKKSSWRDTLSHVLLCTPTPKPRELAVMFCKDLFPPTSSPRCHLRPLPPQDHITTLLSSPSLHLFSLMQEERISTTPGFGQLIYSKEQSTDRLFLGPHLFETEAGDTKDAK